MLCCIFEKVNSKAVYLFSVSLKKAKFYFTKRQTQAERNRDSLLNHILRQFSNVKFLNLLHQHMLRPQYWPNVWPSWSNARLTKPVSDSMQLILANS